MATRLVVLASGRGSNFATIARAVQAGTIPNANLVGLVTNNPHAGALDLAKELNVESYIVDSHRFKRENKLDRTAYEEELYHVVSPLKPDLICLAGYMLILGSQFIHRIDTPIINIHPSILPAFKGIKAQRQALEHGVRWTGCTVHFVTEKLDDGPIILQNVLKINDNDTEESLCERLLKIEHESYVEALAKVCTTKWTLEERRVVWV